MVLEVGPSSPHSALPALSVLGSVLGVPEREPKATGGRRAFLFPALESSRPWERPPCSISLLGGSRPSPQQQLKFSIFSAVASRHPQRLQRQPAGAPFLRFGPQPLILTQTPALVKQCPLPRSERQLLSVAALVSETQQSRLFLASP